MLRSTKPVTYYFYYDVHATGVDTKEYYFFATKHETRDTHIVLRCTLLQSPKKYYFFVTRVFLCRES